MACQPDRDRPTRVEFLGAPRLPGRRSRGHRPRTQQKRPRGIRQLGESEVEINGADIETLFRVAQRVAGRLRERAELTNVYLSLDYSKPEWQVTIDRVRASELRLTVSGIADTLRGYIGGKGQQLAGLQAVVREVLGLAPFFSFLVLAVQFKSLR